MSQQIEKLKIHKQEALKQLVVSPESHAMIKFEAAITNKTMQDVTDDLIADRLKVKMQRMARRRNQ